MLLIALYHLVGGGVGGRGNKNYTPKGRRHETEMGQVGYTYTRCLYIPEYSKLQICCTTTLVNTARTRI